MTRTESAAAALSLRDLARWTAVREVRSAMLTMETERREAMKKKQNEQRLPKFKATTLGYVATANASIRRLPFHEWTAP